jgi:hypothetical protein
MISLPYAFSPCPEIREGISFVYHLGVLRWSYIISLAKVIAALTRNDRYVAAIFAG